MTTIGEWKRAVKASEGHRKYMKLHSLLNHWGLIDPPMAMVLDAQSRLDKISPDWEIDTERHSIEIPGVVYDCWGPQTVMTEIESLDMLIELFEESEKGG